MADGTLEDGGGGRRGGAAPRPLLWLAGAALAGSVLGRALGDGALAALPGGGPAAGLARPGLLVLAFLALVLLALALLARRLAAARVTGAVPLLVVALAFGARAAGAAGLPPPHPPPPAAALAEARTRPLQGRWRALGGALGWIDPLPVAPEEGRPGGPPGDRSAPRPARLLYACQGPPPLDGAAVVALPGDELVPWPAGPVPGPRRRAGRFDALARLRPDELRVLDPRPYRPPGWLERWRRDWTRRLRAYDRSIEAGGLLPALLLGATDELERATDERFARTGTRHLLAVSGLHVGLVAWCLALFTWRGVASAGRPRARRGALASALGLGLYAALTGGRPPVVRAALAAGLIVLAPFLPSPPGPSRSTERPPRAGRRPDPLSLWALALAIELLRDPLAFERVGVQLSYLSTLGLLCASPRALVVRALVPAGGVLGRALALPSRRASLVRALLRPPARALAILGAGLGASCAAVLAGLPVVWSAFGEVSPVGVLATPLALPFVLGAMLLGAAECLLPGLPTEAAGRVVVHALFGLLERFDRLPGTPVPLPPRPAWLLALATAAAFAAWRTRHAARARGPRGPRGPSADGTREPAKGWLVRAACLSWAALLVPWTLAPGALELVALDVGAGTCVVARGPGLPALVFDAGSRNRHGIYEEALGPLLRAWDVRRPLVVLSHLDRDHAGALARLASRHPPRLWAGAAPESVPARTRSGAGLEEIELAPGTPRLDVGIGTLRFAPAPGWSARLVRGGASEENEGSRSLELCDGRGARVLLCGDAEGAGLARVLREGWLGGPLDVLLFPHHGSETAELERLLEATTPEEVWISAEGEPAVGRELDRRGLRWRCSGREGALTRVLEKGRNPASQRL